MSKLNIQKFADATGEYKRKASSFRSFISPGARFAPEPNRYHLYVSYACPWATRTLIVRKIKHLEKFIGVTVVDWHMDNKGWKFRVDSENHDAVDKDPLYGFSRLSELYYKANSEYSGRFTVPVLWDKKEQTIVNNESSEIIRMFNTGFNELLDPKVAEIDLYPEPLRKEIDEVNDWVYNTINNGVYKSGFATKQEVYEKHVKILFEHLDKAEKLLKSQYEKAANPEKDGFFLVGDQLTEADIRFFVTLIRFDPVYVQHFKCNIGMIRYNYPYLHKHTQFLYWKYPGFKECTNFEHIKNHYTKSHPEINPHAITPVGPIPDILPISE